ncbi:hypothetical protein niasHT_022577 [Heterodera trifolii]|uniref:Peptidase M14 domain-containing protein n=1 Tax=Heterodera trifolii TaxID=157864 RepID=A0ABD2JRC5_9BILA
MGERFCVRGRTGGESEQTGWGEGRRPLSLRAVQALKRLYGTEYQVGSGADLLYEASGASHDFAKGSLNIPYSFLIELRPQNTLHSTGFLLPEAEIMDTAEETWEAVKVVADEVLQRFGQFGEERKAWNVSTTVKPTQIVSSTTTTKTITTTEAAPTETTTTPTKATTTKEETTKGTTKRKTTKISGKGGEKKGKKSLAHKHTFKPNTTNRTTTSVPKLNSTSAPSSSVRNVKSGAQMGKPRPIASIVSSSEISSVENGNERKTIVNVKICTGKSGVIPPFPSPLPSTTEESGEEGEGDGQQGTHTLMEILMPKMPRRLIKCRDWSAYCKWWRIHSLCSDPRVTKMCTLSCLIECQI